MVRCLGIFTLCFGISLSARYEVPETLPKEQQIPEGIRAFAAAVDKGDDKDSGPVVLDADRVSTLAHHNKAKRKFLDAPEGIRAMLVMVKKNQDVEEERLLPGAKVDLLIQDDNEKTNGEWRVLFEDVLYLSMVTCLGPPVDDDDFRRKQDHTFVNIALTPEDVSIVTQVAQKQEIRLVGHAPEVKLPKGKRAVLVGGCQGLSGGFILPGMRIDLIVAGMNGDTWETREMVNNVLVVAKHPLDFLPKAKWNPGIHEVLTVALSDQEAARIAIPSGTNASIHFALRAPEDNPLIDMPKYSRIGNLK
jgi:Flp pilus assembly protein CpaB